MTKMISDQDLLKLIRELPAESLLSEESPITENQAQENAGEDSRVWVQNDRILVHYEAGYRDGCLTIKADERIHLFVNQVPVGGYAELRLGDEISWKAMDRPLFEILVSEDKMKAFLTGHALHRYPIHLKNEASCSQLKLTVIEDTENPSYSLVASDVMLELQRLNIVRQLRYATILNELHAPTFRSILIAEGDPSIPGKDAVLEWYFSDKVESQFHEVDGRMDFKNHLRIPQAHAGDLIARKIEPVPGKPGVNVHGELVLPTVPKDIKIIPKKHVNISPTGEIYALSAGRPKVSGNLVKMIEISKEFVVPGDVTIETGNIIFSGDVVVYGNVMDGMIIESLGNVYISGNVYQATIAATGSIYISGNLIHSSLYSGYFGVIFNRLYTGTKRLVEELSRLLEAARMLTEMLNSQGKFAEESMILDLLSKTKFHDLPQRIHEVLGVLSYIGGKPAYPEWHSFKQLLSMVFNPSYFQRTATFENLKKLIALGHDIYETIEQMQEQTVTVDINQCTSSTVKSNGSIRVIREGTVQSHLFAKDMIVFEHSDAVCRGGELEAGSSIHLKTVGGSSGAETVIKASRHIRAERIYHAKVCLGRWVEYIHEPLSEVTVYQEKGRIRIAGKRLDIDGHPEINRPIKKHPLDSQ